MQIDSITTYCHIPWRSIQATNTNRPGSLHNNTEIEESMKVELALSSVKKKCFLLSVSFC